MTGSTCSFDEQLKTLPKDLVQYARHLNEQVKKAEKKMHNERSQMRFVCLPKARDANKRTLKRETIQVVEDTIDAIIDSDGPED